MRAIIILPALFGFLTWAGFAYVQLETNPLIWPRDVRVTFVVASTLVWLFSTLVGGSIDEQEGVERLPDREGPPPSRPIR